MKYWLYGAIVAMSLFGSGPGYAHDLTGTVGLGASVGPAFPLGDQTVKNVGNVGPGVGATVRYGISSHLEAAFWYDYLDLGRPVHSELLTFGGSYTFAPDQSYTPFVQAGLGVAAADTALGLNSLGFKVGLGVEHYLTPSVSVAGLMNYFLITKTGTGNFDVHALSPGMLVNYYFGTGN